MIPKPQRDSHGKVKGDFYPLQKAELLALRKAKLINNAAFVHLALRYENPYCDRPIEIFPKQFAKRWAIPESSVYEAVAKLKDAKAIKFKSGKVVIEWVEADCQQAETIDSQQNSDSGNPEAFWESRTDSENPENVLEAQNKFREPRINSENPENRVSKPLHHEASSASQTIQTIQTYTDTTDRGECEKSFEDGEQTSVEEIGNEMFAPYEERLRLHGIYRLKWTENGLIENPRLKPVLRALKETPPERAERAIAAFLSWASSATNVRDIYKALEVAILRGWLA